MPAVRVMLMLADREEISRGLAEGLEYKEIGLRLGRDSSVISRDVARHGRAEAKSLRDLVGDEWAVRLAGVAAQGGGDVGDPGQA
jgi:IS30 family transposase